MEILNVILLVICVINLFSAMYYEHKDEYLQANNRLLWSVMMLMATFLQ